MATPSTSYAHAGGFFQPSLPSPTPSTASSRAAAGLPHPRSKPLIPGSRKEDYAREYVYRRLLHVSRRYVKKHSIPDPHDVVSAYETFDEVCKDLEEVVDVLWFSGTPTLQVPYLLNVTLAVTEYINAFPPSPRPTFSLLKKLDHCFSSLLQGKDMRTREQLPGFEHGMSKGLTRTDMVRLRSLVDETRSLVAVKMSGEADVDTSLFPDNSDPAAPAMTIHTATTSARKRKAGEQATGDESEDEPFHSDRSSVTPKRQRSLTPLNVDSPAAFKIESPTAKLETGSASPSINGSVHASVEIASGHSGQFHWALDDSDNSDNEEDAGSGMAVDTTSRPPQQPTPTSATSYSNDQSHTDVHNTNEYSIEEEEDEELHMSVAKVYEKTIIELGQTLGETLIDE